MEVKHDFRTCEPRSQSCKDQEIGHIVNVDEAVRALKVAERELQAGKQGESSVLEKVPQFS